MRTVGAPQLFAVVSMRECRNTSAGMPAVSLPPPCLSICRYGEPSTDGKYLHWDHEVLPHWSPKERRRWPHGRTSRFQPPGSVHSPFYPWRGPYSSRNETIVSQHVQELLAANVTVMAVSW